MIRQKATSTKVVKDDKVECEPKKDWAMHDAERRRKEK